MTTPKWKPLTPAAHEDWAASKRTVWFRSANGQVGFGTADLAEAMGCGAVEIREIEGE